MFSVSINVDTSKLEEIAAGLDGNMSQVGVFLGQLLEGFAKAYAPIDTGALRNSLHQEYPGGNVLCQVWPDVDYAIYQELGTYKMAAQPFLTPAVESMTPVVSSPETWSPLFK